jgi:hypothetical protein
MEAAMPKSQDIKLSDSQLVILSAAAQRDDRSLLPFPQNLTVKGAALGKIIETLCKRKFVEERRIISGATEWRRDEEHRPLGLFITKSGLLALGINETGEARPVQRAASMPRQRKTQAAKPRSNARKATSAKPKKRAAPSQRKQDVVIQMLRRRSGVTIDDIIAETGWQPHSVRRHIRA